MEIQIQTFEELTGMELYQILQLRFDVFVYEQQSIYKEYDNLDFKAQHLFITENDTIIAYLRWYQKSDNTASMGRIVVQQDYRKKGYAQQLIETGLEQIRQHPSNFKTVFISAQAHLKSYYEYYGFEQTSTAYDDGGVLHIDMSLMV